MTAHQRDAKWPLSQFPRLLLVGIVTLCALQSSSLRATMVPVSNAGFEDATTPALSTNEIAYTAPFGPHPITNVPGWTFGASGGLYSYDGVANGSNFSSGSENVPPLSGPASGSQNAFVQGTGTISQSITFPAAGFYEFSVDALARTNGGESTPEPTQVTVGAQTLTFGGVADFTASATAWTTNTSDAFYVSGAGPFTLTIAGTVPLTPGPDNLTGLDNVAIFSAVPEPTSLALSGLGLAGSWLLRRRRGRGTRRDALAETTTR